MDYKFPSDKLVAKVHDPPSLDFLEFSALDAEVSQGTRSLRIDCILFFKRRTCSGKGSFIWDLTRVRVVYEFAALSSIFKFPAQKTSSLAHRLKTPLRFCKIR